MRWSERRTAARLTFKDDFKTLDAIDARSRPPSLILFSLDVCEIAHDSRTLACHDIAVRGSCSFGDAALLWLALQCRPRAGDDVALDADLGFPHRLCVFVL